MAKKTNSELEFEALSSATHDKASSKSNPWKQLESKFKVRFSPVQDIAVEDLKENEHNTYPQTEGFEFEELVADIKIMGVIVPLIVRADKVLISGHNRLRASKKAGLKNVPCLIVEEPNNPSVELQKEIMASENEKRRSWTLQQKKEFIKKNFSNLIQQDKRGGDRKSKNQKLEITFDSVEQQIHKASRGNISIAHAKVLRAELNKELNGRKPKPKKLEPLPKSVKSTFNTLANKLKLVKDKQQRKLVAKHLKALATDLMRKK